MNILEVGINKGLEQGIAQGENRKLVTQVCKKLKKGLGVSEIADVLEETEETIQRICDVAEKYAPDYDVMSILRELES